jgi:hypothetical protein
LDELLARVSFQRREKALVYKRSCASLRQAIDFPFDLNSGCEPVAVAHLLPEVRIECQEVEPVIARMTSAMPQARVYGGRVAGLILQQQVQNLAPPEHRPYWFLYALESSREDLGRLKPFVADWVVPFLEEYSSLESLVAGFERDDWRLPQDQRFVLYVAASHALMGSPRKGLDVLHRRFARPGVRREYAQAFEYLSSLLAH